jgi:hypothetical protein
MFEEAALLRSFRRNAAHIRNALARLDHHRADAGLPTNGEPRPSADTQPASGPHPQLKRYQAFAIPLRRALKPSDRASYERTRAAFAYAPGRPAQRLGDLDREWAALEAELNSSITLGGGSMTRRTVLHEWLDAVAFFDPLDRQNTYDALLDRLGHAAEGVAAPLADRAANLVLRLDAAAAEVLEEPLVLPGPVPMRRTPPPPPPPAPWWRRLFRGSGASNRR